LPCLRWPIPRTRQSAHRGEITVTAIREDDGYAPKKATVAGKAPADILEIPQSVSVVTREQIEDPNFFTIGKAL
jgi:outer membrane receptor for ferric coprogen and ferric-rhodotorulic acid